MKRLVRFVIVCAVSAIAAVPAAAQWTPGILSSTCVIEISNVCGGSWATVGTCVKARAERFSKRCQGEIARHVASKTAGQRNEEAAQPDAAPGARPAP
jgi:hypothetical protein